MGFLSKKESRNLPHVVRDRFAREARSSTGDFDLPEERMSEPPSLRSGPSVFALLKPPAGIPTYTSQLEMALFPQKVVFGDIKFVVILLCVWRIRSYRAAIRITGFVRCYVHHISPSYKTAEE